MRRFRLRNVKTASKIIGAFGIVCLVLGALGVTGIWTTAQMKDQTTAIAARDIPQIVCLTTAQNAADNAERDLMQAALEPDMQV
ncbi:MAG TPA: MCP four helix bundle domain-containing protein [Ktedonobacterales bacterium]|nr:MCP four helix bundle domain-containing protein [Ktedonobacterales bacterium]